MGERGEERGGREGRGELKRMGERGEERGRESVIGSERLALNIVISKGQEVSE